MVVLEDVASPLLSLEVILEQISKITAQMQRCRKLEEIVQTAIADARILLRTDRVLVYRCFPEQDAGVVFESVNVGESSLLGYHLDDLCGDVSWVAPQAFQTSRTASTVAPIAHHAVANCQTRAITWVQALEVKAHLVLPLCSNGYPCGWLIVQHCYEERLWQPLEVQYVQQIAEHLGLAIQQTKWQQSESILQENKSRYRRIAEGVSAATGEAFFYSLVECLAQLLKMDHTFVSELVGSKRDRARVIAGISNGQRLDGIEYDIPGSPCEQVVQQGFGLFGQNVQRCFPDDLYLQEIGAESYIGISLIDSTGDVVGLICISHSQPIVDDQLIKEVLTIFAVRAASELERQRSETLLRVQQTFTDQMAESTLAILYVYDLVEHCNIYCNPQIEAVLGYSAAEIQAMGEAFLPTLVHPDDQANSAATFERLLACNDDEYIELEYRLRHKNGSYRWLLSRDRIFKRAPDGSPIQSSGVAVDITLFKETQAALCRQVEREQLLADMARHIRQTLNLDNILNTAVTEVRNCLQTDRVLIYRFNPDWSGVVIAESVAAGWRSVLGMEIADTYFIKTAGQPYDQGCIKATRDVRAINLEPCHRQLLERMQVRAKLVVPILQNDHLWGLLVAQHCSDPRDWQDWEIDLQQQIATQIAIAVQQSELYHQVQMLNIDLEAQVQQRTAQLQQALDFEALLKRITDRVRDSLDEGLILQTVVEELVNGLALVGCDTGFYSADHTASTIAYTHTTRLTLPKGQTFELAKAPHPEVHDYLLNGEICQFCNIYPNFLRKKCQSLTTLAVPICDDQETLGDLWLFRLPQKVFTDVEIRLVQQVANQCAIALRQSRLYQAAQAQVKELERLNRLKDDFLSTVSHELRTPMSNIRMATQMLEITLGRLGVLSSDSSPINRYVKVLQEEEERELSLINDLLDLARLDAGVEELSLTSIELQFYVPHLAEGFAERAQRQQQHLIFQIPADLPSVTTDLPYLERIISELLNNACKYTPAGGIITLSAQALTEQLELRVSNSGTEIAIAERDRIFDKFYRIPNSDPWKHGGTGLGLALVKKLTMHLGGTIHVESNDGQTTFILTLALACSEKPMKPYLVT